MAILVVFKQLLSLNAKMPRLILKSTHFFSANFIVVGSIWGLKVVLEGVFELIKA